MKEGLAPKKKDFKAVCKACMNGTLIDRCPSTTCLLAPLKDGKKSFRGSIKLLKRFCRSCDPEGYKAQAICRTEGGCPLEGFYNRIWGRTVIPYLTYIPKRNVQT